MMDIKRTTQLCYDEKEKLLLWHLKKKKKKNHCLSTRCPGNWGKVVMDTLCIWIFVLLLDKFNFMTRRKGEVWIV